MGALMQADESSLASLTWLEDLPQRIQQYRQRQQQELHGSQQESEAEGVEEAEEQVVGTPVQMLLFDSCTMVFLYKMLLRQCWKVQIVPCVSSSEIMCCYTNHWHT